jgi:hypothetical protein
MFAAPRLYPDELLSSGLVRFCRWYNLRFKVFAREVLHMPQLRASFLGICPLSRIAPLYNVSPEHLLWHHTTFPYATGFVSGESYKLARRAALNGGSGMAQLLAVMQNASFGISTRKICLKCVQDDLAQIGETYWHRAHNLPGVWMCAKHRCSLVLSQLPAGALKTEYRLPIECATSALVKAWKSFGHLDLARRSVHLLNRKESDGAIRTHVTYLALAGQNGWLSSGKQVNAAALTKAVTSLFSSEYLREACVPIADRNPWPALGMRASTSNFTTLKHLLLETALSTRPSHDNVLNHSSPGPRGTADRDVDGFYAPLARQELIKALKMGEALTTEQFLRRVGALGPYRHRGPALPKLRRVVLEFRASPASVKQLAAGKTLFRKSPQLVVPSAFSGELVR